jgi:hypothetical protein
VFAAPRQIAGESTQGQAGFSQQQNHSADCGDEQADAYEGATEAVHRFSLEAGWRINRLDTFHRPFW